MFLYPFVTAGSIAEGTRDTEARLGLVAGGWCPSELLLPGRISRDERAAFGLVVASLLAFAIPRRAVMLSGDCQGMAGIAEAWLAIGGRYTFSGGASR